jgi:hypothetical protein
MKWKYLTTVRHDSRFFDKRIDSVLVTRRCMRVGQPEDWSMDIDMDMDPVGWGAPLCE